MSVKTFSRDWSFSDHDAKKETKVAYKIYLLTYTSRANGACEMRLTAYRLAKEVKELEVKNVGENYRCNVCGNEVTVTEVGGGTLVCCGEDMELVE